MLSNLGYTDKTILTLGMGNTNQTGDIKHFVAYISRIVKIGDAKLHHNI